MSLTRRPDQYASDTPPALGAGPRTGFIRARTVIITGTGPTSGLFVYNGAPALGNPPQVAIVPTGVTTDPYGNAIASSLILIQGNLITETGGSFRTAATAPLLQLDGPHNAFLSYDAAAHLTETIAPVATNDGLGNTVLAGITNYTAGGGINLNLLNGAMSFILSGDVTNATVSRSPGGTSLNLLAATTAVQVNAATFALGTAASGTAPTTILGGPTTLVLNEIGASTTSAVAGGPQIYGNASGHLEAISDSTNGDSNRYDMERLTIVSAGATINSSTVRVNVFSRALGKATYEIDVWLVTQNTTAADGAAWSFAGSGGLVVGAGSLMDFTSMTSGTATTGYGASTTFSTSFNGQGVAGNQLVHVRALLVVTTAGTLTFGGLELVSGNTVTVSAGSRMRICPVVAT